MCRIMVGEKKLSIAFYAGRCIPIHARSLDERPLGGTETGLIRLAEVLEARGHSITVFSSHKSPPPSKPRYLPADHILKGERFDLIVLLQEWKPAFFNLPSNRIWFWTGDGAEQYSNYGLGDLRVIKRIEKFLAVSTYHKESVCGLSGFPSEKCAIIGNGVHLPYFEGTEVRNRKRLIFTSAPYRGLHLVPALLNELRISYPGIEFHGFTGMSLYDRETPFEGPHVAHYREIHKILAPQPGVTLHGNVAQSTLAREYMRSSILFYPNTVAETCCITALEAQAAGCAIVTSELGALRETVGDSGVIVPGEPGSEAYMRQFIHATKAILGDDKLFQRLSETGRARALRELSWDKVADRFESLL